MKAKIVLWSVLALVALVGLSFAMGWTNVFYTKTVGKAKQNADREVFEQTQSYIEGKRQELVKFHHEWTITTNSTDKKSIEAVVRQSFANFDETKITDPDMYSFLKDCKNK
jgi:hypothetical protein